MESGVARHRISAELCRLSGYSATSEYPTLSLSVVIYRRQGGVGLQKELLDGADCGGVVEQDGGEGEQGGEVGLGQRAEEAQAGGDVGAGGGEAAAQAGGDVGVAAGDQEQHAAGVAAQDLDQDRVVVGMELEQALRADIEG